MAEAARATAAAVRAEVRLVLAGKAEARASAAAVMLGIV